MAVLRYRYDRKAKIRSLTVIATAKKRIFTDESNYLKVCLLLFSLAFSMRPSRILPALRCPARADAPG